MKPYRPLGCGLRQKAVYLVLNGDFIRAAMSETENLDV
jgi:hypothetical protein